MNRTEFNLQKAIDGAELVTRDGRKVTNFRKRHDFADMVYYPYVAEVNGLTATFTKDGTHNISCIGEADLFLATPNITPDQVKQYVLAHPDEVKKWLNPPLFTSYDGVEMYAGDRVFSLYQDNEIPDEFILHQLPNTQCWKQFSSNEARQSYIDGLKPKVLFTTVDGVDIFEEKQKLYCIIRERHNTLCEPYAVNVAKREGKYMAFSTEQARHSYMVMNMPLLSVAEIQFRIVLSNRDIKELMDLATSKLAK